MTVKRFATFGMAHLDRWGRSLSGSCLIVEGETGQEARMEISKLRGPIFCTDYDISELENQMEDYGITEVSHADADIVTPGFMDATGQVVIGSAGSFFRDLSALLFEHDGKITIENNTFVFRHGDGTTFDSSPVMDASRAQKMAVSEADKFLKGKKDGA